MDMNDVQVLILLDKLLKLTAREPRYYDRIYSIKEELEEDIEKEL